jgi:hypothetical protein
MQKKSSDVTSFGMSPPPSFNTKLCKQMISLIIGNDQNLKKLEAVVRQLAAIQPNFNHFVFAKSMK